LNGVIEFKNREKPGFKTEQLNSVFKVHLPLFSLFEPLPNSITGRWTTWTIWTT